MTNKEKIEKLFEARNETAIAEPNWAICQSLINQVITALKAEHLEAKLAEAKERIEGLEKVFGMDEPWSLLICAKQLVMSANHLLNDHNCDGDGYEKTEIAKRQMEKYIIRVEQALKAEQKG